MFDNINNDITSNLIFSNPNGEITNPLAIPAREDKKEKMDRAIFDKVSLYVKKDIYHQIKLQALNQDKFIWEVIDKALREYITNLDR